MIDPGPPPPAAAPALEELLADEELTTCCAAVYAHPGVRWLLGGELHPGGVATTRRALELIGVRPGERLLDIGSGDGSSALLAAREFGCVAAGLDAGEAAVHGARHHVDAEGFGDRVDFTVGEAGALPFADDAFEAVLCECSLSTFPDQARAMSEIRRVLRPGGRLALSDVIVDRHRLPAELDGPLARLACVGGALSRRGYEELLIGAGLSPLGFESRAADAAVLAERVRDRLRGARVLGFDLFEGSRIRVGDAIEGVGAARRAIADGALDYAILLAAG